MPKEKHTTFRIDEDVKKAFKAETEARGIDMTEAVQDFMINYVKLCRNEA